MAPQVSVVMPVYNQERYLPAALSCILNQTLSDFELLVVDDGSVDGTRRILDTIRDPRVRVIYENHGGVTHALRRGILEARSPWIARMDSDDICTRDRLQRQLTFLHAHPDYVFVGSVYGIVTPNDHYLTPIASFDWQQLVARDLTLGTFAFADGAAMFSRDAACAVGLYDPDFRHETTLWYRLLGRGFGAVLGEPCYYYRWRVDSGSHLKPVARWDQNKAIRERYDPANVHELAGRERPIHAPAVIRFAARAVSYYLQAGDVPAAREIAWQTWRRAPFTRSTLELVLRATLRRVALRPGTAMRVPAAYRITDTPWPEFSAFGMAQQAT